MTRGQVVTVNGPIAPERVGITDAHDHLFLTTPALPGQELDDLEKVAAEVGEARAGGMSTIVELTPIGLGRRPELMRRVAGQTGIHVVAASGYHRDAHYPAGHWVYDASEELLHDRVRADIEQGMHPDDWLDPDAPPDSAHAGVVKLGASYQHISAAERKRFAAAAAAAAATGTAVVVHTEIGTCADEVIDLLTSAGLAPQRIVLAHMDRNPDAEWHAELLARGVYLVYDTPGRIKYQPDSVLLDLISRLVEQGFGGQLLLGLDLGQRDYFRSYGGGPGLRYLLEMFAPRLRRRIGDDAVRRILVDNPARAYAVA